MGESTFFFAQVRVHAVRAKSELSNQRWMVFSPMCARRFHPAKRSLILRSRIQRRCVCLCVCAGALIIPATGRSVGRRLRCGLSGGNGAARAINGNERSTPRTYAHNHPRECPRLINLYCRPTEPAAAPTTETTPCSLIIESVLVFLWKTFDSS
jgi:hypothetical protein